MTVSDHMTDDRVLQHATARAVVTGNFEGGALDGIRGPCGLPASAGLQIAHHQFLHSVSNALVAIFPASAALVSAPFLLQAARAFVADYPPADPHLAAYGSAFPEFFGSYAPASSVPYVADVLALEWAIHKAQNAASAPRFILADDDHQAGDQTGILDTAKSPHMRVVLAVHPSVHMCRADVPLLDLWNAAQGLIAPEDVDMSHGPDHVCVVRIQGRVYLQALSAHAYDILGQLQASNSFQLQDFLENREVISDLAQRKLFCIVEGC